MSDSNFNRFLPKAIGPYQGDLNELIVLIDSAESFTTCVASAIESFPTYPTTAGQASLKYRAYLYALRDLLRQGWTPHNRQGELFLQPPKWTEKATTPEAIAQHKKAVRLSIGWERDRQFEKAATQRFIEKMERSRPFGGEQVSIRDLIADGAALAAKLQPVARLEKEDRPAALRELVQPYLQLVKTGQRCKHTHLLLQDIWRYFRYTWRTPYNPTPGRKMFYLVRDAAQPKHPIIGIAALGSSLVQLTARDDVIGWTPTAFEKRISAETFTNTDATLIASTLQQTLLDALEDVALTGLVTEEETATPDDALLVRLEDAEKAARAARIEWLRKKQLSEEQEKFRGTQLPLALETLEIDASLPSPKVCMEKATAAMYKAKRARVLRELLTARQALSATDETLEEAKGLRSWWESADGNRAIRTLLRANKKRKVGINLMDIIVCGAVAPYNVLLGGKLVAMLMAGPQIVHEYREKYAGYASNIASKLKGEAVERDPQLVFLGTTSLFARSSQYNRVKIPTPAGEWMELHNFGLTKGFGSVHFSAETRTHLNKLLASTNSARLINNRFGEGVNPKLRRVLYAI